MIELAPGLTTDPGASGRRFLVVSRAIDRTLPLRFALRAVTRPGCRPFAAGSRHTGPPP